MKQSLLLAFAFGIALSACSKKKVTLPLDGVEQNKQSSTGRPADPVSPFAWSMEKPLNGVWQTVCQKDQKLVQNGHVSTLYSSSRLLLEVQDGQMKVRFIRFIGDICERMDLAAEMGESGVWSYEIVEPGDREGREFKLHFVNQADGDESEASIVLTVTSPDLGNDSLEFVGDDRTFTRRAP